MANGVYTKALEGFMSGGIDWIDNTIKCALVTASYTATIASDQYFSTINNSYIIATSSPFTTKTVTGGVADADNVTFTAPTAGVASQVVIYQDTGNTATSHLIAKIDTATGLPVTTDGSSNVLIVWDNSAAKLFSI
jgi:hypothetical protein